MLVALNRGTETGAPLPPPRFMAPGIWCGMLWLWFPWSTIILFEERNWRVRHHAGSQRCGGPAAGGGRRAVCELHWRGAHSSQAAFDAPSSGCVGAACSQLAADGLGAFGSGRGDGAPARSRGQPGGLRRRCLSNRANYRVANYYAAGREHRAGGGCGELPGDLALHAGGGGGADCIACTDCVHAAV